MKVKTTIIFEAEYPLSLEFYETNDEEIALKMERACVAGDPAGIIDAFGARGNGTFTTSVERVEVASDEEEDRIKILLRNGRTPEAIAYRSLMGEG